MPVAGSVRSEPVRETFRAQTVWDGVVEVFDVRGHAKATQAFAWSDETDERRRGYVAVLAVSPVHSAIDAVRAAVIADASGFNAVPSARLGWAVEGAPMLEKGTRLVAAIVTAFLLAVAGFQVPVVATIAYRRTLEADIGSVLGWLFIVGEAGGALWAGSRWFVGWFGLVGKVAIGFGLVISFGLVINFPALIRDDPMLRMIGQSGVASIVSLGAACIVAQRRANATA